jgi:2,5-dihydroxypyridine 5,6-dioxygenase
MNRFPFSFSSAGELVPRFRQVLEMCRLTAGEVLLLHSDTTFNPHYPAACFAAGLELGAKVYQITVPARYREIEEEPTIVRAWQEADLVLDLVSAGAHLFSVLNTKALDAGTRVLRIAEPVDVLERLFPLPEVRERSEAGAKVLTEGTQMRITSPAGTDLVMDLRGREGVAQHGVADVPGRWDHWPSGLSLIAPIEGSVRGSLVAGVGDVIFVLGRYLHAPIRCQVENGGLTSIEGGVDAFLLREWIEAQRDARTRIVGVVGWGTDHRARWDRVAWHFHDPAGVMDCESFYGNVRIGLGINASSMLKGENRCKAHIDIQLRQCSVWVDDLPVLIDGEFANVTWRHGSWSANSQRSADRAIAQR